MELLQPTALCPCGSQLLATSCCLPVLADHRRAETALILMRSRYTAFALRHESHILASWHPKTRPTQLNFDDFPVKWIQLAIHQTTQGGKDDLQGTVEFTSSYVEAGQFCHLREKSTFLRENGLWYYLNGECRVTRSKTPRNNSCPCGSGKKFKHCCQLSTLATQALSR